MRLRRWLIRRVDKLIHRLNIFKLWLLVPFPVPIEPEPKTFVFQWPRGKEGILCLPSYQIEGIKFHNGFFTTESVAIVREILEHGLYRIGEIRLVTGPAMPARNLPFRVGAACNAAPV